MKIKTRVVVFGGSGFLGSHVADALTDTGYDVSIYDIKPSAYLKKTQRMIVGNILDRDRVSKSVKASDIVYNFAGIADIDESRRKPLESVETNILGNSIILEACRKAGVRRFVFASSLYVYSKNGSFYRSTKQACELLIENYNEIFGLPYSILRYGSLYGARANEKSWINSVLKEALSTNTITRQGDGEEIREYIHILDAAKLSAEVLKPEYKNQYVIISGNQQTKIKDLLIMIKEILGNQVKIRYLKAKYPEHYEITPYNFNPKLAKRLISNNYVDLGQGILELIKDKCRNEKKYSLYI